MPKISLENADDDFRGTDDNQELEKKSNVRFTIYDVALWTATVACVIAMAEYLGASLSGTEGTDFRTMAELGMMTLFVSSGMILTWVVFLASKSTTTLPIAFFAALAVVVVGCAVFTLYADFYRPIVFNEFVAIIAFVGIGPLVTLIGCVSLRRRGYRALVPGN